jgi:hypothetical protein
MTARQMSIDARGQSRRSKNIVNEDHVSRQKREKYQR